MQEIERRVRESELNYSWVSWKGGTGEPWLEISLQGGHEIVVNRESAEAIAACSFEHWRGVPDYHAYVDLAKNTINARLQGSYVYPSVLDSLGFRSVTEADTRNGTSEAPRRFTVVDDSSVDYFTLESLTLHPGLQIVTSGSSSDLALTISPANVDNAESARVRLTRLAGAILFDLDNQTNLFLQLSRRGDGKLSRGRPIVAATEAIRYPRRTYDSDAMTLYNFARDLVSDTLMPMRSACYLGYYQVLEYFMPAYSRAEAVKRLRSHLKDPTFDPDDDIRVGRLLNETNAIKRQDSERNQLRATLRACLSDDDLAAYLRIHADDATALASAGHISDVRRISANDSATLVDQCADRVYELRCRIVHSKDSDFSGRPRAILPLSDESALLDADIQLIEFLARQVLASSGKDHIT
ncbi:hypothetical protein [Pseudonocardia oroxyli]|uniref:hypothetical protein n=1 Tax=Pseudonocardia oroxyli TaxID=366584 RepID=UPI00115FB333|nr:hypothetical protein [Pseudonocardia oroxyli]